MTIKELTKLVKACRKLGVNSYKDESVEFTLSSLPDKPIKKSKKVIANQGALEANGPVLSDGPSQDELLFWSTMGEEQGAEGSLQ